VGDLAIVSALDQQVFTNMRPLVNEVYVLDQKVADAAARYGTDPGGSAESVARLADRAFDFNKVLNVRVADILREIHPTFRHS
jgi:hypothetical protein